jgi:hypothetical protein
MKKHLLTLICIMSINLVNAQIVNIPDAAFKAALVNNPAINTNGDGEIQVTEAAAYTSGIFVSNMGIADMTGIEEFTAIDFIDCSSNYLTSLNVSANIGIYSLYCENNQLTSLTLPVSTTLQELVCYNNQLTSLDVSANTALGNLACLNNQLTSLNVTSNTALYFLNCSYNQLTSLDVSANTNLLDLLCAFNQLTSLNVSANSNLVTLYCNSNFLTSLDVSANTILGVLICRANQLTSLNVSSNTSIGTLLCDSNQITSLNLSADIFLDELWCQNNQLTSLNVQNGFNTNITDFNATNNPNLTCIQVDNVGYSNFNWSAGKDATASFSTNCGATSLPEIGNIANVQIFPNPANNHLTINLPNAKEKVNVTITDITGKIIYTITASDTQKVEVNTQDFAAGIYVVQIQSADFIATKKLVIEK